MAGEHSFLGMALVLRNNRLRRFHDREDGEPLVEF